MPLLPRPEVESLVSCVHGGPNYGEIAPLNRAGRRVLDFSVSSNPYGPPPGVRLALNGVPLHVYPDSDSTDLRKAIAGITGLSCENVVAGSGSMEIIRLATTAFLRPGDRAIITAPTFGEYEVAAQLMGAAVMSLSTEEASGFSVDADKLASLILRMRPRIVFLCNPNNPTGQYMSQEEVLRVRAACEDTLLILDEAYVAFVDGAWLSTELVKRGNILIVRSLTKDFALAGLRVGYGLASTGIIQPLRKVKSPWNVSSLAQQAGIEALRNPGYITSSRKKIAHAKQSLRRELSNIGLSPLPSPTNFFLVKVGDARQLHDRLLPKGILVRDCSSFGLPQYIRIGVRTAPDNRELVRALKEILN
ncbi:MAG: histidinol-phosphate transaminase [Chloroflexi bacterium]|nr:histidinol-phosphate transaminase [Chloroflexota bacterium]